MGRQRRRTRAPQAAQAQQENRNREKPADNRPGWRRTLDDWGGIWVVGVILATIVLVAALAFINRPTSPSDAPLIGEEVPITSAAHVTTPAELVIPAGRPPAGGPHYPAPLRAGVYEEPVPDGNAIHSLEHGMIWISYAPDLVTEEQIATLEDVQGEHSRDVLLSPRPENEVAIAAVSWGRIITMDQVDRDLLEEFINNNTDHETTPEPGIR